MLLIQGDVSDESGKLDVGQIVSGLVYATKELRLFSIRQKRLTAGKETRPQPFDCKD